MRPIAVEPRLPAARGFSLIELLVAVAIVGILASIAYPSYLSYTESSNRTDATTTMINYAQILQRCYSQTYDYTQCVTSGTPPAGVTAVAPGPVTSPQGYYNLSVSANATNEYEITATPAKSPQTSDSACTEFTLDNTGTQGSTGTASSQTCWGSN